jgi:two-component sensor histidine kinase
MPPSDAEFATTTARERPAASPAETRQLLAIGLDHGRLDSLAALTSPHINLFVTSSPQKALVWTRLEPLDLILLRFGPPVEQALDLVQALIEANPAPPILLLVEPEAEAVAQHLSRRQICAAQPATIATEQLKQLILRLLGPPTERQTASRSSAAPQSSATAHTAHSRQSIQPAYSLPPLGQHHSVDAAPRSVAAATDTHGSPSQSKADAAPMNAPGGVSAGVSAGATSGVSGDWELPFLDQLVIELAHRLKNPLVSIKTFTHLLQERFNDPDFRARFYSIVNNDVIQLNDIVDRLLEFTEFSRPYPKPLNLAGELKQATESLEPFLQSRQVTVHVTAPENTTPMEQAGQAGTLQIFADPTQFRYLLKQLMLDSAATAPAGSRLQIRLLNHPTGRDRAEPTCAILIDTIMASTAPRLHEWLSLELLLAKNLMERHRGTVTVTVDGNGGHGDGGYRHRRVTATFSLGTPSRTETRPAASAPPASVDRRKFPLSIAFRERRASLRRQEQHAITFADRRRHPEGGETARAFQPHEERPRPGSPPPYAPG